MEPCITSACIYCMYNTTDVSHNKWLLGGGLHSSCASLDYKKGVFKYLSFCEGVRHAASFHV